MVALRVLFYLVMLSAVAMHERMTRIILRAPR
jgi:hypothetical protein